MSFMDYLNKKEKEIENIEIIQEKKKVIKKTVIKETKKPEYKITIPEKKKIIPPKKEVKSEVNHANSILEGIPEDGSIHINERVLPEHIENTHVISNVMSKATDLLGDMASTTEEMELLESQSLGIENKIINETKKDVGHPVISENRDHASMLL